jgi:hypothetical protein
MGIDAGDAGCTHGMSRALYAQWTEDEGAGLVKPLNGSAQASVKSLCWSISLSVARALDGDLGQFSGGGVTQEDVSFVLAEANAAAANAAVANAAILGFTSDDSLSPPEKKALLVYFRELFDQRSLLTGQATEFGVSSSAYWTALGGGAWNALVSYMAATPVRLVVVGPQTSAGELVESAWAATTTALGVGGGAVFRAAWASFYAARAALLAAISHAAITLTQLTEQQLADIASDNVLSPGEKSAVVADYDALVAEAVTIDAQAALYSVSSTTYDAAVSSLVSYFAGLTTPYGWRDHAGNTTIVGTTFRSTFALVATTRLTVLDAISAAIKHVADVAQGAADGALTLAGSKTKAFYSGAAPLPADHVAPNDLKLGDLWFSTDTGTTCPDTTCLGRPTAGVSGPLITGAGVHRYLYVPHRWDTSGTPAWKGDVGTKLVIASEIAAGAIVADKVAANAITAGKIDALAVTAGTIAAGAITADKIAANAIKTGSYTFSGTEGGSDEVALSGAKLQSSGTALIAAAGNLKVGTVTFDKLLRRYAITIASGAGNGSTAAFAATEPDTNYGVAITPTDWTGSPTANNFTVKRVYKYTNSVSIDVFTSNAAGTTVTFEVIVFRLP